MRARRRWDARAATGMRQDIGKSGHARTSCRPQAACCAGRRPISRGRPWPPAAALLATVAIVGAEHPGGSCCSCCSAGGSARRQSAGPAGAAAEDTAGLRRSGDLAGRRRCADTAGQRAVRRADARCAGPARRPRADGATYGGALLPDGRPAGRRERRSVHDFCPQRPVCRLAPVRAACSAGRTGCWRPR